MLTLSGMIVDNVGEEYINTYLRSKRWLNIIKECRTSGLPDKTWCLDHGIQPSKFYYHIRRLKAKACEITERDKDPHLPAQGQEVVQLSFEEPQGNCVQRNGV